MKTYLILTLLLLAGCTPSSSTVDIKNASKEQYQFPPGLQDCTYFQVSPAWGSTMNIIRCPMSSTSVDWTTSCGKNCIKHNNTITIDGVEYVQKGTQ